MTELQREFSDLIIRHPDAAKAVIELILLMKGVQLAPSDPAITKFVSRTA